MEVKVYIDEEEAKKLGLNPEEVPLPVYAHPGDAGMDFFAPYDIEIPPRSDVLVNTCLRMEIPENTVMIAFNRSSMALKGIIKGAQVVDSSYRGIIKIHLINLRDEPFKIKKGDKIIQFVILPFVRGEIKRVGKDGINWNTSRGEGGFGSTG
ncbi:MAG: dUTP diphosphatase [Candidatus Aminicenantes bacterium]|nr:dUTP diphosphatase [Candidatus Aminicenantes bacterium]